jgi:hypothetical protein
MRCSLSSQRPSLPLDVNCCFITLYLTATLAQLQQQNGSHTQVGAGGGRSKTVEEETGRLRQTVRTVWRLVGTHDQVAAPQASRGGGAIQISNAPLGGTTLLCQALVVWKLTPWVAPGYQLLSNHSSDTSHCSGEHISNPGGYGEPAHGSYIPNPKTHHTKRDRTKPNIQKQPFSLTPLPSCTSTHSSGEHLNPRLGFTTTRDSSITQRYSSTHSSGEHLNPRLGFTTTPDSSITQRYSAHTTGLTNHPGCLFDRLQLPEERMAHLPAP